jgi:MFS family permease
MNAIRAQAAERPGALSLLASRRFGPLFWTQALSAFNDGMAKNALVLMIAYRAASGHALAAQLMISLAGGLYILPFFLFSARAGEIADRIDKARLIRIIKLVEIALMAAASVAVAVGLPVVLLGLLALMGVAAAFFGPAKYAILPDLLAENELLLGNALIEAGTFLAILFGTITGALIVLRDGAPAVALLIVAIALAAWAASRAIPAAPPSARAGAAPIRGSGWHRWDWRRSATLRVLREARRQPVPFRVMLAISWFWLLGATYLAQLPAYVRFDLGGAAAVVTLLLSVFSVGIGLGSLVCNRLLGGRVSAGIVPWGALGLGLFSIDLWAASPSAPAGVPTGTGMGIAAFLALPAHWRVMVDLFGIAAAGGIFVVPLNALLQTASAAAYRARTIAANNVVNAAAMVFSTAATMALLAAGLSIPGLFLLCGLGTLVVALWVRRALPGLRAEPASSEDSALIEGER